MNNHVDPLLANPIISAIVERAEGLPLYVQHVLEDLRSRHFRFADLPHCLPRGLSAYYDDLLRRMSIGNLQAVLTPLIVTLAWARAPLGEEVLQVLLARRKVIREGDTGRHVLRKALAAVQSMIRRRARGYEIYHPRFRDHIQRDEAGLLGEQNALARSEFVALARDWRDLDRNGEAFAYVLRQGPAHLAAESEIPGLAELLSNLTFAQERIEAVGPFGYTAFFRPASQAKDVPEPQRIELRAIERVLDQASATLATYANQFIQEVQNGLRMRLDETSVDRLLAGVHAPEVWLRLRNQPPWASSQTLLRTLQGHMQDVRCVAIDERRGILASGSKDKTVKLWNLETGRELRTLTGHGWTVNCLAIEPTRGILASGSKDKTVKLWNLETGRELCSLQGHTSYVNSVAIDDTRGILTSGSGDNSVKLWDLANGRELRTLKGHTDFVTSVALDGTRGILASGSADSTVRLWDLSTGREIRTPADMTTVTSIALDGARGILASGCFDTVNLWDLATGRELRKLEGHTNWVHSVAIDQTRGILASGSCDNTVNLWDLATAAQAAKVQGHAKWIYSVAIDRGRGILASGSYDNTVKLWDLEIGHELRTLEGHRRSVYSVAIDGARGILASGSEDNTVKLWDLETGHELRTLEGHTRSVLRLATTLGPVRQFNLAHPRG